MGLDTVTLLVDIEKHFDISIPDREAEKIYTVQDFVNCVFAKVTLDPSQKCKSQILFYRVRSFFVDTMGFDREWITPESKLNALIQLHDVRKTWTNLEEFLNVKLPDLSALDLDPTIGKDIKFLGLKIGTKKPPITNGSLKDLVNWILSLNHEKFINPKNLCSKADVEKILIGIISASCGVPVDEIRLEHSITNDLGMD